MVQLSISGTWGSEAGRRLTSLGRRDLDRIAAQIKLGAAEKAKKAAAAEAVIAIA